MQPNFGKQEIISDHSLSLGGNKTYPELFDYFLASMPLCAGFYIRKFCEQRNINTQGISLTQEHSTIDEDKYQQRFAITVRLPEGFPDKYKKSLLAADNACTVKKVIQAVPEVKIAQ